MDVSTQLGESSDGTPDSYSFVGRLVGILGGVLGCFSLLSPIGEIGVTFSAVGQELSRSMDVTLGEMIGLASVSDPMDGAIIALLSVGGSVLAITGGITLPALAAVGGTMMCGGAGYIIYAFVTGEGGSITISMLTIATTSEPAYGVMLLGVGGVFSLISLRI